VLYGQQGIKRLPSGRENARKRDVSGLRILLAHSFYRIPGGEDHYVRRQVELLSREHSVELVAERNEQLSPTGATAVRMLYSRGKKQEVAETIARFDPDVLHVHNVYPSLGPAVHLAAATAHVPLVMTVHNYRMRCPNGLMFTEGSACRRCQRGIYVNAVAHRCFASAKQSMAYASVLWVHRFLARLDDKVSLFITPSNFVRNEVVSWGIPPNRVVAIPNFVEPRPDADPRPGRFGVFLGRLSAEKGVDVLLDALRIAGDPPFRVVGDGPLAGVLRSKAETTGLKNTEFLGWLPHDRVNDVLREARFLALPSVWDENCPLAALEALALGRPLLVTSQGGLPELVRQGTGLVCPPGDPHAMAEGIGRLMGDDVFCAEAGARGLEISLHDFGPKAHLARLEAAYGTCIKHASTTTRK
jgi:glycosyltransferase involved in cell wall biosynthesis